MPAQGGSSIPCPTFRFERGTSSDHTHRTVHLIRRQAVLGGALPLAGRRHRRRQRDRRRIRARLPGLERRLQPTEHPRLRAAAGPAGAARRWLAVRRRAHRPRRAQAGRGALRRARRRSGLRARRQPVGTVDARVRARPGARGRDRLRAVPLHELASRDRRARGRCLGARARHQRSGALVPGVGRRLLR